MKIGYLTRLAGVGRPRRVALLLLLTGALVRLAWLLARGNLGQSGGEATNVAMSIARTGIFGDVFGRGSGATAHFTPSMQAFAGLVYRLFGIGSPVSETILVAASVGLTLGGAWIWYRIAEQLEVPAAARLFALAAISLLPLNFAMEVIEFRTWEGALAVALAGLALLQIIKLDQAETSPRLSHLLLVAALCALTFFINPAIGLAAYAAFGLLLLRNVPARRWPVTLALAALFMIVVVTPWAARNYQVFDRFIPLRSNFGLELALANYPGALSSENPHKAFRARLADIHPQETEKAFRDMLRAGGEPQYADQLGKEAKRWISEHPESFARLSLRHWFEYYFPPKWLWNIYSDNAKAVGMRQAIVWGLSLIGLVAALWLPIRQGARFLYVSLFILVPALPYMIVQPVPRYRYLVFAPMIYGGAYLIFLIWSRVRRRAPFTP